MAVDFLSTNQNCIVKGFNRRVEFLGWSICKKCIIYSKKTENNQKKRPGCPIFKQKCQPNLEILPKRAASGERDLGVDLVLEVALKDAEVDVEIGLILNCGERVD